ncbi:AraC family transcriptional regulator [Cohnella rhizosphaerae]|uniref:AraC family transcriptional regulator n=1 Tax=Cohnella rhizosphaerae TaxID=1457232 RepID=A0A9X4KR04_9BACL|nr:AraC family transcriptional regulator [Cohnella rhizosphaerae]MDG0808621.1 AraC family transcriptional regulator [Cohnella rhizosphaerae]
MNQQTTDLIKLAPGFWTALKRMGLSGRDIARQAGLPVAIINEPAVTVIQYFAIWRAYADLSGDTAKGIVDMATAFETAQYPPTVLATYHAPNYRDALFRMVRYKQLCPPESLSIREEGDRCTIGLEWWDANLAGPPVLIGVTLAYLLELGRRGTGLRLSAQRVEFAQPMGDTRTLEAYFGCPVLVGGGRNRLTLRRSDLDRPFVSFNEELVDMLTPALDRTLDERLNGRTLSEAVKHEVKRSLAGGRFDIRTVGKTLGLSDRTLQRRLAGEDASFKGLVAQARREQACACLADASIGLQEVAFLVGYKDQNSFYRAFRQWEGKTPSRWREEHSAAAHTAKQ